MDKMKNYNQYDRHNFVLTKKFGRMIHAPSTLDKPSLYVIQGKYLMICHLTYALNIVSDRIFKAGSVEPQNRTGLFFSSASAM